MQRNTSTAGSAEWAAERASGVVTLENAARAGYVARGVVYAIVAWLAIQAALTAQSNMTGARGALARITAETYGQLLLALVAVGLAAFAFWRLVQCFADPDNEGRDLEGVARRALFLTSGLIHAGLAVWAGTLIVGSRGSGSQLGAESFAATLMARPYGQWLVAAVGAIVIAAGIGQLALGYRAKFTERLRMSEMSASMKTWVVRAGRAGLMARGIVFWIIGGFFIAAAYQANSEQVKGFGEALRALERAPYGPWLLGVVGAGLLGYAGHQFVQARFRKLPSNA